ncbi:MAG: YrdB family protein [Candidatus Pristimantibacillus sp.]
MFIGINLMVRFLLELVIFLSFAYWGFKLEQGLFIQFLAGLGLPIAGAFIWGKTLSPKRTIQLSLLWRLVIESLFIVGAFLCLYDLGYQAFAIGFGILAVVNRIIIVIWDTKNTTTNVNS